jgi:hypothetical protein
MDTYEVVDFQIDSGHRLITRLVQDWFEVTAAFWMRTAEEGYWSLYIATPLVEQKGLAEAYGLLQASIQQLQGIPLSLSDVKLVGVENPITKDVLRILSRQPGRLPTRYGGRQLGNITVEGAYIYPDYLYRAQEVRQMSARDVMQKVLELMNRTGILESSTVTLTNGMTLRAVPIGLELLNNVISVKFIVDHLPSPQTYPVSEIAEIKQEAGVSVVPRQSP